MPTQAIFVRAAIALSLALFGLFFYHHRNDVQRLKRHGQSLAEQYEMIKPGMTDTSVFKLLGNPSDDDVHIKDWPQRIGEISEFKNGCPLPDRLQARYSHSVTGPIVRLPADSPLKWTLWLVPGEQRWIAIAFAYDGECCYPAWIAITKKDGRDYGRV
jgi:hypothetical protein